MTKRELLEAIQKERAAFEAAWAGLTPEQMTAPGVMGEWSVKDILGHVAMWESRLVTILYSIEREVAPKMLHGQAEVDKVNAESFAEQRERPLDRVLADFHAVHVQLLKRLDRSRIATCRLRSVLSGWKASRWKSWSPAIRSSTMPSIARRLKRGAREG